MFNTLPTIPKDIIFQTMEAFQKDTSTNKVDLSIGVYKNIQWWAHVPGSIQQAFRDIDTSNFNYTLLGGRALYLQKTAELLLNNFNADQTAMQATTGGTHALSLLWQMVKKWTTSMIDTPVFLIGDPTRSNHFAILKDIVPNKIPHLTADNTVDVSGYIDQVYKAPDRSYLFIHGWRTHNPTGLNFTNEQIQNLLNVLKEKKTQLIIDMAYAWLGQTFEEDKQRLSQFWDNIDDVALAVSYSKNASIYDLRTGALFIKTDNKEAVEAQLQQACREVMSPPPGVGQKLMENIFTHHFEERQRDVKFMREQIQSRRNMLLEALDDQRFGYLTNGRGLFGILPLNKQQIQRLQQWFSIYMLPSGRINFSGINKNNAEYVADSIKKVL